jgi:hypothetical protein
MMARSSIPPAVATVRRRISGSGFSIHERIWSAHGDESLGEAKVFEKLYREALELVGAYGKLIAVLRKCVECVDDSRKGP